MAKIKLFLKELTRRFTISSRQTRVGIVVFSSYAKVVLRFSANIGAVYRAIDRIRVMRGRRRNIGRALRYAGTRLFRGKARCGRRRVLILITSGKSRDRMSRPARAIHSGGVELYAVAVGRVKLRSLLKVTTDARHVLIAGYSGLLAKARSLKERICYSPGEHVKSKIFFRTCC